jgi:hypothetical protein
MISLENIIDLGSYICGYSIVILGSLVTISIILYPIWFLLNNVLYRKTQASIYFAYYIAHRASFIEWYKENKPNVYTPKYKK